MRVLQLVHNAAERCTTALLGQSIRRITTELDGSFNLVPLENADGSKTALTDDGLFGGVKIFPATRWANFDKNSEVGLLAFDIPLLGAQGYYFTGNASLIITPEFLKIHEWFGMKNYKTILQAALAKEFRARVVGGVRR